MVDFFVAQFVQAWSRRRVPRVTISISSFMFGSHVRRFHFLTHHRVPARLKRAVHTYTWHLCEARPDDVLRCEDELYEELRRGGRLLDDPIPPSDDEEDVLEDAPQ